MKSFPETTCSSSYEIFPLKFGVSKVATTAVVIHQPGGPEILKLQQWPKPVPTVRQVLIRVKAFGLDRSEIFGRQ
jgi:hypothetical protein